MSSTTFDIAIIGAGAAGLNLALALAEDSFADGKKILVLERNDKTENDRTWCWWEIGEGKFDHILHHSWKKGRFFSAGFEREFSLAPYQYKMLRGIDFYGFAKKEIEKHPSFFWQKEEVKKVEDGEPKKIEGTAGEYFAKLVFDSRMETTFSVSGRFKPSIFGNGSGKYIHLLQHFKGWYIRTEEPIFDPAVFTQFDFRLRWPDSTSFTYILPISEREALVEFTFFSPELVGQKDYEKMLRQYCEEILSLRKFEIIETEYGVIPMSTFPFEKTHTPGHIRIGTAGGWVKPSTGYSFRNAMVFSEKIVDNLKSGSAPQHGLISPWHRWMGKVLINILYHENETGPALFREMYQKHSIQYIFKFLDEETSLTEDIRWMARLKPWPFLRAIGRQWRP